ncbi:NAD(P)H-hydrate dehydratase [Comamonas sp. GB3 AK4-5]|uniref:NAD(P)H-hydrate dehydratase n=1 Tax=Comamonas sp. GB3 AK4-5 TaxID=3231487 RepID=UPI00351E76BA
MSVIVPPLSLTPSLPARLPTLLRAAGGHPLHDTAATRLIEAQALAANPQPRLMQRAGLVLAQLGQALAPHARQVWVACGPGNNGGDGLQAAAALQTAGYTTSAHWLGTPEDCSPDTLAAWRAAQQAGVQLLDTAPPPLGPQDLAIDALLGIGATAHRSHDPGDSPLNQLLQTLYQSPAPVLCADLPSGLNADTGRYLPGLGFEHPPHSARHTLSFLTLKPGLFTSQGRDAAGTVWWAPLGVEPGLLCQQRPSALLGGPMSRRSRPHDSHKGRFGDVTVIGGEGLALRGMGMGGAAVLAATAALHQGAGRVMLTLLDGGNCKLLPEQPELMLRRIEALRWDQGVVVCGCGGGQAVAAVLPQVLEQAHRLVLDADALNAIAADSHLQRLLASRAHIGLQTILTPHPLEAARMLDLHTDDVQANRLEAAHALAQQTYSTVVLKGSGSIIHSPHQLPCINTSGNALLATGGTGDVLAGMVAAAWAAGLPAHTAAQWAVWQHGHLADTWPAHLPLTASALARCA